MSSSTNVQQLQDDIDLFEGLLQSVSNLPDMDEDRDYYRNKLADLKEQINRMGNVWSSPNGQPNIQQPTAPSTAASSRPTSSTHTTPDSAQQFPAARNLSLPNRKRDRGEFDDDLSNANSDRVKSRKSTPAHSPAISTVDSVDSNFFDDPDLGDLLGSGWRDDMARDKEARMQREALKRQQKEDEDFARRLQEEWNSVQAPPSQPSRSSLHIPPSSRSQATLKSSGSFTKPAMPIKQETTGTHNVQVKNEFLGHTTSDSDDEDLAVVEPNDWHQRFPPPAGPSRYMPLSFGQPQSQPIPGAFPTRQSAYTSVPGSTVYGSSSQPQGGSLLNRLQSLNPLASLTRLGSQTNPFDLEGSGTYPFTFSSDSDDPYTSRSWATVDPQETQEEIRQLLHNIRPDEEIDPSEAGENQPEALKVRLMPHQLKGVAWMRKMEEGSNRGGILADDMGLGKTVQSIAIMLARPPAEGIRRPTLVVTPVALMEQWKREIGKMIRGTSKLSVTLLHGAKSHASWATIKHFDVVLTSYGTLASELKRKLDWEEKLKLNPDIQKTKRNECPILDDKARFHRVFLDEAQNIKNKSTKAAAAACRVTADYRWCLSGTPMQNNVEEMFSYIKFLRIRPYNDQDKFSKDITRPLKGRYEAGQARAMEKLQALLKAILLRRTKKSTIDGQPILQLPEKRTVETRAIFDKDQHDFYKALETQSQIQFNKFVKAGTVGRNYSKALVLLLRLRQCCCSPQLITNSADFVTDSGVEGTDLVANAKSLPPDVVARIKDQEDMECPICMDAVDNPVIFNPCGHANCHDCFSRMVDGVTMENAEAVKCPHCRARIDTKKITDYSSFREVFLDGPSAPVADEDDDSDDDSDDDDLDSDDDAVESDGSDDGDDLKDFIVNDDAELEFSESENEDDLDGMKKPKKPASASKVLAKLDSRVEPKNKDEKKKKKKKSKGKKKEKTPHKSLADLRKDGLKSRTAKKKYLKQLKRIYEPCAKIEKTLELLRDIHDNHPGEKTIVFSSFTSFLDLVEVPLFDNEDLQHYTRYDGSMTAKDRNEAVLRFTDNPDCKVMLVSLKAGNAGLNLTIANHVLILDPFWNPFVEYQAADRCHRIGQKREVTVHRVLIGEEGVDHQAEPERVFTVEDRILQLQEKKRRLVESALDENAASGVSRLGIRELGYLFGVNDMPTNTGSGFQEELMLSMKARMRALPGV